jgi:hypothetical protein
MNAKRKSVVPSEMMKKPKLLETSTASFWNLPEERVACVLGNPKVGEIDLRTQQKRDGTEGGESRYKLTDVEDLVLFRTKVNSEWIIPLGATEKLSCDGSTPKHVCLSFGGNVPTVEGVTQHTFHSFLRYNPGMSRFCIWSS